jgi:hypothetical protein
MRYFQAIFILSFVTFSLQATVPKLSMDELAKIAEMGHVTRTIPIKDATWPKVEVKILINATPLSSVAIFAAYDYQKNYVPNLTKSTIHKLLSPTQIQVEYELKMPWPLSPAKSVNHHILSSPSQGHYQVSWTSISNTSAKEVEGRASFLPFPGKKNKTLMIYESRVVPKSFFAGIFRKLMVKDVEKSIKATQKRTEELIQQKSTILIDYENKIIKALKGKNPY